jgi:hypothetical protein
MNMESNIGSRVSFSSNDTELLRDETRLENKEEHVSSKCYSEKIRRIKKGTPLENEGGKTGAKRHSSSRNYPSLGLPDRSFFEPPEQRKRVPCHLVSPLNLKDLPKSCSSELSPGNCSSDEKRSAIRHSMSVISETSPREEDIRMRTSSVAKTPALNLSFLIGNSLSLLGIGNRQIDEDGEYEVVRSSSAIGILTPKKGEVHSRENVDNLFESDERKIIRSRSGLSEFPKRNDSIHHTITPRTPRSPKTPLSSRVSSNRDSSSAFEIPTKGNSQPKLQPGAKKIDWDSYPDVSEKGAKEYHLLLASYLKVALPDADKTKVSSQDVDSLIQEVCKNCLDDISDEENGNQKLTKEGYSPRTAKIYENLHTALIGLFIERLQIIESALYAFLDIHKKKSACIKHLACLLQELIVSGSSMQENNLLKSPRFLGRLAASNKGLGRFLESDSKQKAYQIFKGSVFNDVNAVKSIASLGSDSKAMEIIKGIRTTLLDEKDIPNRHLKTFDTELKSTDNPDKVLRISQISVNDVLRSIISDECPHVEIKINNRPFLGNELASSPISTRTYFQLLFSELGKTQFRCPQYNEPEALIDRLMAQPPQELPKNSTNEFTYLDLLRTCTINAWGHGRQLASNKWPQIFNAIESYEIRAAKSHQNLRAFLTISGPQQFETLLQSLYTIKTCRFYADPNSSDFEQRTLANLELTFKLTPVLEDGNCLYEGDLCVSQITFEPSTTFAEKKAIIDVLQNPIESSDSKTELSTSPKEEAKTPKTPRELLGSSPRSKSPKMSRSEITGRNSTSIPRLGNKK